MGKLIMNGVPYGGGDVEANPSGTATDTLTKLGIEGTVYEIQGGGGGGTSLILNACKYSTDEQVVGIAENGKPIYRKTVFENLTDGTIATIPNGENIRVISATAYAVVDGNDQWLNLNYFYSSSDKCNLYSRGNLLRAETTGAFTGSYTKIKAVIEYTKTTDSAGSGGYQAYGFSPIIYSEEEREVGVWTDNKPLYQKTYRNVAITNNADNIVDSSFTLDKSLITYKIDMTGLANTKGSICESISDTLYVNASGQLIYYLSKTGTWWSALDTVDITVFYTKTTDTAGSGEYNTLGIPNVHYDGNEKVIGTWFGETLYQQCIDLSNITINAGSTVTVATIQGINLKKALGTLTETDDTTYAIPDGGLRVKQYGDDIKLTAMGGSSWVIAIGKLIIEYTKTS